MSNVLDLTGKLHERSVEEEDQKARDALSTAVLEALSEGLSPQDIRQTVRETIKAQRQWDREDDL